MISQRRSSPVSLPILLTNWHFMLMALIAQTILHCSIFIKISILNGGLWYYLYRNAYFIGKLLTINIYINLYKHIHLYLNIYSTVLVISFLSLRILYIYINIYLLISFTFTCNESNPKQQLLF